MKGSQATGVPSDPLIARLSAIVSVWMVMSGTCLPYPRQ